MGKIKEIDVKRAKELTNIFRLIDNLMVLYDHA